MRVNGQPHTSNFEITTLLFLGSIDKVEQILGTVEGGGEGRQGASFVADQAHSSQNFGQTQNVGVDTNHDAALVCLQAHRRVHQLFDRIAELAGGIDATLAASLEEMLLELVEVGSIEGLHIAK